MTIGEDLIAVLGYDMDVFSYVSDRISQGAVNETDECPRIWVGRSSRENILDAGGVGGMVTDAYDIEIVAEHNADNDGVTQALAIADAVRSALHGKRGAFGASTVLGVFVDDQADDYLYKSIDSPDGYYTAALSVRIIHN